VDILDSVLGLTLRVCMGKFNYYKKKSTINKKSGHFPVALDNKIKTSSKKATRHFYIKLKANPVMSIDSRLTPCSVYHGGRRSGKTQYIERVLYRDMFLGGQFPTVLCSNDTTSIVHREFGDRIMRERVFWGARDSSEIVNISNEYELRGHAFYGKAVIDNADLMEFEDLLKCFWYFEVIAISFNLPRTKQHKQFFKKIVDMNKERYYYNVNENLQRNEYIRALSPGSPEIEELRPARLYA
jgi:hypothetical protein